MYAETSFRRNAARAGKNVPEQRRGNVQTEGLREAETRAVAEAEPPTGGEAYTDLLCEVALFYYILLPNSFQNNHLRIKRCI
jgi:hypothetical protein